MVKKTDGRGLCRVDVDILDRLKREARYRKSDVDATLNRVLRKALYENSMKKKERSKDFRGYCPNCKAVIKESTLLRDLEVKVSKELPSPPKPSFMRRLFSRGEGSQS